MIFQRHITTLATQENVVEQVFVARFGPPDISVGVREEILGGATADGKAMAEVIGGAQAVPAQQGEGEGPENEKGSRNTFITS